MLCHRVTVSSMACWTIPFRSALDSMYWEEARKPFSSFPCKKHEWLLCTELRCCRFYNLLANIAVWIGKGNRCYTKRKPLLSAAHVAARTHSSSSYGPEFFIPLKAFPFFIERLAWGCTRLHPGTKPATLLKQWSSINNLYAVILLTGKELNVFWK